jgi:signal transduction histidine kinase
VQAGLMVALREFRLGAAVLCTGLVLSAVYFLLPSGGNAQLVLYEVFGGGSVASILWGIRRYQPRPALPWYVFALAQALFVCGDILFDLYPNWLAPSPADVLYLAAYPLLGGMALMLVAGSGSFRRVGAITDGLIVTLAFAAFQWIFVMSPALHAPGPLGPRIVYGGLYPFMDIVLLGAYAGFFVSPAWRTPAFMFLVLGAAAQLLGDEANGLSGLTYQNGDWVDWGWMASYLFFGVAALHPTMRDLSRPSRSAARRVSRWRIASLAGALLTVPVARLIADIRGQVIGVWVVAALAAVLAVLVIARLGGILRALERIRVREEAARRSAEDARQQLVEQNARLVEADRLKDEFVALVAHDLRTPLTSIIGYVELALDEEGAPLDPERRGFLEVVARSSDRLLRLVDDLLLAARLQTGQLKLALEEVDVVEICEQAMLEMRARAEQKNVALSCHGEGPATIRGDRRRLLQLLDNLISNGIKFTLESGVVEIRVAQAGPDVSIEVLDTGIGIEPGEEERVFERFYRSPGAVSAQVPGTGLGLFIARAVVEAHGGRISAARRAGGGSVFRLELPKLVALSTTVPELVA